MAIGVADSVFADSGFNPENTLRWASKHGFSPVQIYLNPDRLQSPDRIHDLNREARELGLELIAHAPGNALFDPMARETVFSAARNLLKAGTGWDKNPYLVWHIDPDKSVDTHLEIHECIRAAGLKSAPENYMVHVNQDSMAACMNLLEIIWQATDVVPVLDLPRFFSTDNPINSEIVRCAMILAKKAPRTLLHIIDGVRPLIDRTGWCPPGQGVCRWDVLWPEITELLLDFAVILEYEDRKNPIVAREWLMEKDMR